MALCGGDAEPGTDDEDIDGLPGLVVPDPTIAAEGPLQTGEAVLSARQVRIGSKPDERGHRPGGPLLEVKQTESVGKWTLPSNVGFRGNSGRCGVPHGMSGNSQQQKFT